ncbi:type I polyketide synthase [Streptomyces roseus]|uniref:type I polyketide synthase n=1 Tax=Streptomyces roseus TaxID=66430 RepID=UPI00367B5476
MRETGSKPIAIVGMDCRLPGGVDSPDKFWDVLAEGRHLYGPLPTDRGWDLEALAKPGGTGDVTVRRGVFLDDVCGFDAAFFGVGPHEAQMMDPQQRLLLESAWTAIERARIAPSSLDGTRMGVYVGLTDSGYQTLIDTKRLTFEAGSAMAVGTPISVASGRVAFVLGVHGPAITVDTACSSSLVALHQAVRAIRAGECDAAIAAGVAIMTVPNTLVMFGSAGALTADGRSKAFSEDADGFAPAEGVASVVLMPLERALATGRKVLAVIRGTAVNHDGVGEGLAVPNGAAQVALMKAALRDAGLSADQVDLVEAHGTGTKVGDPVEAKSIQAVYGRAHTPQAPVWIGSGKSNIGHTQQASGLVGVIKAVLALQHERMPATLHAERPTPAVDWSPGTVRLLQEARDWPRGERVRRAGVLAYGIGGTNAHAIVEEAPLQPAPPAPAGAPGPRAWPISATSQEGLRAQAAALADHLRQRPELDPDSIGWSLATTRSALPERAVMVGPDRASLLEALDSFAQSGKTPPPGARARALESTGTVFVFPGQGPHWTGMGARLLEQSEIFAAALHRCAQALAPYVDFDVIKAVTGTDDAPALERSEVVQPAMFAVYVALAELWRSYGVEPTAVIGHSQGEIAAAHIAGVLTLDEAARVVAARSRTLRKISGTGAMASLALPADRVRTLLARWEGRLEVAVVNGPSATAVSGDATAMDELLAHCAHEDLWARRLPVDYASHCFHVEAVREEILAGLTDLHPQPSRIPIVSSSTGQAIDGTAMDAAYWYESLRRPVLFDQAVAHSLRRGHRHFVEVSPHPVLSGPIREIALDSGITVGTAPTLHRGNGGTDTFLASLGTAHASGIDIDWTALYPHAREVDLPTYRFQRRRYWVESTARTADLDGVGLREAGHPWLTVIAELADGTTLHTGRLSLSTSPWMTDHALFGVPVLPATGMFDLLLHGVNEGGQGQLLDIVLEAPLILTGSPEIQVRTGLPDSDGLRPVTLHSRSNELGAAWILHAQAKATAAPTQAPADHHDATSAPWPPQDASPMDVAATYGSLAGDGYLYGPAFRNLTACWRATNGYYNETRLKDPLRSQEGFTVHPALLDAALHGPFMESLPPRDQTAPDKRIWLPHTVDSVTVHAKIPADTALRNTITFSGPVHLNLAATDTQGRPIAEVKGMRMQPATARALRAAVMGGDATVYRMAWRPLPHTEESVFTGWWEALTSRPDLPVDRAHSSMADLISALPSEGPGPDLVVLDCRTTTAPHPQYTAEPVGAATRHRLFQTLADLRGFLGEPRLKESRLVMLTRHAQSTDFGEAVTDVDAAACAGLLRAAAAEYGSRLRLIDSDETPDVATLAAAFAAPHRELAVRGERLMVPRYTRADDREPLNLPADGSHWQLAPGPSHTLEDILVLPVPDLDKPPAPGTVRVRMEASSANFRDSVVALGVQGASELIGTEGVGRIVETAPDVTGRHIGERVIILAGYRTYSSLAEVDHRTVFPLPPDWSTVQAATLPTAFVTAHWGLHKIAHLRAGQKVLIHSAAGALGMAAVQVAKACGAEVYATASPSKHALVAATGVPAHRIANSRSLDFEDHLRELTDHSGFDIVFASLAGEFVDASLRLVRPGGWYIENGKTDIRDAETVRKEHGVNYAAVNLLAIPADERTAVFEQELMPRFASGDLTPLPAQRWNIRYTRQGLRRLSQGHTTGKLVLTQPITLNPEGTVLISGGLGTLGGLLAKHLITTHQIRHLLLLGRQGPRTPGAAELTAELQELGASVTIAECDVADRPRLAETIAAIPAAHPLTAVIHAAGLLVDGPLMDLTPEQFEPVLRAKIDGAVNLHELTAATDLQAFVLYSSASGQVGNVGQASYNAANTFLDALAHHRRSLGLPAISIAWGLWEKDSGMTGHLGRGGRARMAATGFGPLSTSRGMAAFDSALELDLPQLTAFTQGPVADGQQLFDLMADLPRRRAYKTTTAPSTAPAELDHKAFLALPPAERHLKLTDLVRTHAALILGYPGPHDIPPNQTFRKLGFDSLSSVELRTRVTEATGVQLAATAVIDHSTAEALAHHLQTLLLTEPEEEAD